MVAAALLGYALGASLSLAHECRLAWLRPPAGGPVYGHHYFDRRISPIPDGDATELRDSASECDDRTHFLDGDGECLTNEQVRGRLEGTRAKRLQRALTQLDAYQESYRSRRLAGMRPAWNAEEADRIREVLRVDGDVLPEDVAGRYEAWLRADGWSLTGRARVPTGSPFGPGGFFDDGAAPDTTAGAAFAGLATRPDVRVLDAQIDAAWWTDPKAGTSSGYTPEVKRALKLIARYADPQDARDAIDILARHGPRIQAEPDDFFPSQGGMMQVLNDPKTGREYYKIRYNPGYLIADGHALRTGSGQYDQYLGVVPNLAPYLGESPLRVERRGGMIVEVYADSEVRRYGDVERAQTLLHELMHIRTRETKAGAVIPLNEEKSRQAELRFIDNYARATGAIPQRFLSPEAARGYLTWKYDRHGYRRRLTTLLESPVAYHVEAAESAPEGLETKLRAQLALSGEAFTRAKRTELAKGVDVEVARLQDELGALRRIGAISEREYRRGLGNLQADRERVLAALPSDAEFRKRVEDRLARVPNDKKLHQQLTIDDLLWRQRYQFSLPVP
ncbi:MAG: hypothetical protein HY553_15750 [Elusimicrobia bacterium]|nr:hypothetical protein [Elusimicrobiota bacterium]